MIYFKAKQGSPYLDQYGAEHPDAIIVDTAVSNDRLNERVSVNFAIYHSLAALTASKRPLQIFSINANSNADDSMNVIDGSIPQAFEVVLTDNNTDWSTLDVVGFPNYTDFWNYFQIDKNGLTEGDPNGQDWMLHYNGNRFSMPFETLPLSNNWEILVS